MIKLVHHEMVINSKFLEVPRSYYQRHLNANRVKRIAAEFDERIANAPKVSYRNGHYYVFDGQHTIAALKLRNNNCDLDILCKVYTGLTEAEEALLFAQQTGISAPLTAGAKTACQDPRRRPGSHRIPECYPARRLWSEFQPESRQVEDRLHRYGLWRVPAARRTHLHRCASCSGRSVGGRHRLAPF